MSAIDRRLDKLEEAHAPPVPPVKWRHRIANSRAEADQISGEWDAGGLRENLIVRVIVSNKELEAANEGTTQ